MNLKVDFLEVLLPGFICDFVCGVLNSLVFNCTVFFALFLVLLQVGQSLYDEYAFLLPSSQHDDESQSESESELESAEAILQHQDRYQEVMISFFTVTLFRFGFVLCAFADWIGLDKDDSGMMVFGGRTLIVLLACVLTLTAYVKFVFHHLFDFRREFFYGVNSSAAVIESDVNRVVVEDRDNDDDDDDDDDDDYYYSDQDDIQDMDSEVSTNITFYTSAPPVKSKSRIPHIGRRTSPLYWRHPLLSYKEYSAVSSIRSPGRSFVPAGRVLLPIPESVHFFPGHVSQVHMVPRDGPNEIARGRRIVTSDIDSHRWSSFLRAGRGWFYGLTTLITTNLVGRHDGPNEIISEIDSPRWSFLRVGRAWFCWLTELATTILVGRHEDGRDDDLDEIEQGHPALMMPDVATVPILMPFFESQPSPPNEIESPVVTIDMLAPFSDSQPPSSPGEMESPELSLGVVADTVDDDDVLGCMFTVDDEDHIEPQDTNEVEDLGVAALVVYKLTEERTNVCAEDVPTGPVVPASASSIG